MDTAQWPQEIVVKPIEEIIPNRCTKEQPAAGGVGIGGERKATRPQKEQALNCPRCDSANTKFCYYNNYSLSQPRYFCKTCRRYWTEGGSLRNIPVGGGSRKNKRSSNNSSSPTSTSSKKLLPDLVLPLHASTQNANKIHHEAQDLNLAFPSTQDFRTSLSEFVQLPINIENSNKNINHNMPSNSTSPSSHLSALELLTGITSSRGLNSFMHMPGPDPNSGYTSGSFPLHEFKPPAGFNFSVDGLGSGGYGVLHQHGVEGSNNGGRVLFPFEDLKQVSSTSDHMEQNRAQGDSTGYWTGMLGGGSW